MKGFLVLETGEVFQGLINSLLSHPISADFDRAGEVVFNTSHSGYEEVATDPSYFSQIVVMTAPMQGNYGADKNFWESRQLWIEGFICVQAQNTERDHQWRQRLAENKIHLLSEVDTRALVLRLRRSGTPWGAIVASSSPEEAVKKAQSLIQKKKTLEKDWVWLSSRRTAEVRQGQVAHGPRVAVLDFGVKENILRELVSRCSEIKIFPSRASVQEIQEYKPDGLMLTNGPGDPADVQVAPQTIKEFLGRLPVFGICMGHQVLCLALGAKTYKMKFGHRGANHPIRDELLKQIYVSSQNHGYAVDESTLPQDVKVTQRNLNDQTVAGIYSEKLNCLGIQYHPESHPGPHEATRLFDFYIDKMMKESVL